MFGALWCSYILLVAPADTQDVKTETPSKKEPRRLLRSSFLAVIVDAQALKLKVAEARRITLGLDQETQNAKAKISNVSGVFELIHLGLAKPAKPGEYGGGMLHRLETIENNLSKTLLHLSKLPSTCEPSGAKAQWNVAVAGRQLLLKTLTQTKQAQVQATWTAQQSDKLIKAAILRLKGAKDETALELDSYNQKLKTGLDSVAKTLGKGLAAKNLDKKVMPQLGAQCGSVPAVKLPDAKEAGMALAGANAPAKAGQGGSGVPVGDNNDCGLAGGFSCTKNYDSFIQLRRT